MIWSTSFLIPAKRGWREFFVDGAVWQRGSLGNDGAETEPRDSGGDGGTNTFPRQFFHESIQSWDSLTTTLAIIYASTARLLNVLLRDDDGSTMIQGAKSLGWF